MRLKTTVRSAYFRSAVFRRLLNGILRFATPSRGIRTGHLAYFDGDEALGPVQRDEALMLFSVIRVLCPRVVVEFGFGQGHSAFNFLQALDATAVLHSFDWSDSAETIARREFESYGNFIFHKKSQADFSSADVEGKPVDLAFIDASHDLGLNIETFKRLAPCLSPEGLVAIHDTGVWRRRHFAPMHRAFAKQKPQDWLSPELFQHQRDEREFVNWIISENSGYSVIHFHSCNTVRHGLTFVAGTRKLLTVPAT